MPDIDDRDEVDYRRGPAPMNLDQPQPATTPPGDVPEHLTTDAIVACQLCDDDGYRGARVCDHQDHSTAEGRERAKQLLDETLRTRKVTQARQNAPAPAQPQESASEARV